MILSNQQATLLVFILRETLSTANLGGYDNETRRELLNEIINQQSTTIIDLEEKEGKDNK